MTTSEGMQKAYMDTKWAQIDAKCEGSKEKKEITAKKKEVIRVIRHMTVEGYKMRTATQSD